MAASAVVTARPRGPEAAAIYGSLAWMAVAFVVVAAAFARGLTAPLAAGALAAALAPALWTLLVAPQLSERWAQATALFAWIAFATLGMAVSGGPVSPMAACIVAAPALARLTRAPRLAAEACAFAGLALLLVGLAPAGRAALLSASGLPLAAAAAALFLSAYWLAEEHEEPAAPGPPAPPPAAATEAPAPPRSQRMAELSHELRTPLTHILGFTEILSRKLYGDLTPKQSEYVELIRTSGNVLLELITGLMDLSRVESGRFVLEKARFDVRDLAGEVVRLNAETAAAKGLALRLEAPDAAVEIEADPRAVRQILSNLIGNALKFSPAETSVVLRCARVGGEIELAVADQGPGIPEGERARMSEAFARGASAQGVEGVGLGLALVRAFAELHGGRLFIADNPGGGAVVGVRLPSAAPP